MNRITLASKTGLVLALTAWVPVSYGICLSFCTPAPGTNATGSAPSTAAGQLALSFKITDNDVPVPQTGVFFGDSYLSRGFEDTSPVIQDIRVEQFSASTGGTAPATSGRGRVLNWGAIFEEMGDFEKNVAATGNQTSGSTAPIDFSKIQVQEQRFSATQGAAGAEETRQITESRDRLAADIRDRAVKRGATETQIAAELNAANLGSNDKGAPKPAARDGAAAKEDAGGSILNSIPEPTLGELISHTASVPKPAPSPEEVAQDKAAQSAADALFSGDKDKASAGASVLRNAPKEMQNRIVQKINEHIQKIVNDAVRAATAAAAGAPRAN